MKIKRTEFIDIVKRCLPGVDDGKGLLQGADAIVFDKNWCHAFNDNISVSVPTDWEDLVGAVKASELYKIVTKLKDDEIELSCTAKTLVLKGSKAVVEMALLENTLMPHISSVLEGVDNWQPVPEDFKKALDACRFVANTSAIAGVFVEDNIMASTDEKRINKWEMEGTMDRFYITDASAGELLKLDDLAEYSTSVAWLHIKTAEGTCFSCKRLDDRNWPLQRFKDILEAHVEADDDLKNTMPPAIIDAVERASALYTDISGYQAVQLTIGRKDVEVSSQNTAGKYKEKIAWETPFVQEFKPFKIFVDLNLVKYAFNRASSFYIKRVEGADPVTKAKKTFVRILFTLPNFIHLMSTIDE